tara:strand:+ start:408 stop:746 length:339 start_codon:yes stop_codon:yes gene_type:complete
MELMATDFHFYDNGKFKTEINWDSLTQSFSNDIKQVSTKIRMYGTEEQIDKALDDYIENTGLNLDEAYDLCADPVGSFHYNADYNVRVNKKLKELNQLYLERNSKVLIINLR